MTRKDYIKFAKMFNEELYPKYIGDRDWEGQEAEVWNSLVTGTADIFEEDNPRFDRNKFFRACGHDNE